MHCNQGAESPKTRGNTTPDVAVRPDPAYWAPITTEQGREAYRRAMAGLYE